VHPEMSLVFLTLFAGVGQGIFIALVILTGIYSGSLDEKTVYISLIVSIIFQYIGSVASLFHLGNPQRMWKAVRMWRQSWLSREALALGGFTGLIHLYLGLYYLGQRGDLLFYTGILAVIFSLGFFLSSSMLYAKIRFIREWHNPFTTVNFTLSGLFGGSAFIYAILLFTNGLPQGIDIVQNTVIALGVVAFILKLLTFRFNSKVYVSVDLKHALGKNDPSIRLMDMGTSYGHYNTKEYYYPQTARQLTIQKLAVIVLAFLIPLSIFFVTAEFSEIAFLKLPLSLGAVASLVIGYLIERRLFFIQGNHIQNLYYGNFKRNITPNPILSQARKGTPVP